MAALGMDREFLPLRGEGGTAYGADQYWFPLWPAKQNGCGVTAACNVLCWLALRDPRCRALYPGRDLSRESFLPFMRAMYRLIRPGPLGLYAMGKWQRRVLRWGRRQGVPLRTARCPAKLGEEACAAFLEQHLAQNLPVAVLSLSLRRGDPYGWHWMTVTGFDRAAGTLTVSTWGQRRVLDWPAYFRGLAEGPFKGGFAAVLPAWEAYPNP